jgi:hypothetical protein
MPSQTLGFSIGMAAEQLCLLGARRAQIAAPRHAGPGTERATSEMSRRHKRLEKQELHSSPAPSLEKNPACGKKGAIFLCSASVANHILDVATAPAGRQHSARPSLVCLEKSIRALPRFAED